MSEPAVVDLMAVCLARLLRDGERVLHGVSSLLPMVAVNVAKRLHAPNLVYLSVAGGVDPSPPRLPWSSTDQRLTVGATAIFANEDFYDLCARGGIDVVFLGAAQIDRAGRINTSAIGDYDRPKVRLPGGGGAAAIMPTAGRIVVWRTQHTPRVFSGFTFFAHRPISLQPHSSAAHAACQQTILGYFLLILLSRNSSHALRSLRTIPRSKPRCPCSTTPSTYSRASPSQPLRNRPSTFSMSKPTLSAYGIGSSSASLGSSSSTPPP